VKNGPKALAWSSTLPHLHHTGRLGKSFSGGFIFGDRYEEGERTA